jgi:putative hydrolases of HD superfamily
MSNFIPEYNRLNSQTRFLLEIDKLKHIIRQTYLPGTEKKENSAEHSWHLAVMAMVLQEHSDENVNLLRVLKMLLIHDIVEIDAGDTYCYDPLANSDKSQREILAADRIFGLLPNEQGLELRELWEEFEARLTPESKFAAALDCLMPVLHNYHTQGRSWKEHGVTRSQVMARVAKIEKASAPLWKLVCSVIDEAVAQGFLSA